MRRSLVVLALAVVAGALVAQSSGAAPAGPAGRSAAAPEPARPIRPALADPDRDGVSDELGARLAGLAAGERVPAIVLHDGSVPAAAARRAVGAFPAGARFTTIDGFAARLTRGQVRALAALPGVTRVQGDALARTADASSDADYGAATARTAFGVTGADTGICVLDTGADPGHEQLAGRIARFRDFVGTATAPYDDQGHGTHVASIAAGDGTGGPDAAPNAGVAPGASLIVGKVLNAQGSGTTSQIVAGLEWCAGLDDVDVITMSLATSAGSDGQDALSLAANAAADAGKVVTAAAGNAGDLPMSIGAPGAAQGVVTVGAGTDWSAPVGAPNHDDGVSLAYFSSRGPTLDGRDKPDVIAPGTTITAALRGTTDGYATYSGTSMATPYVAGVAALAIEAGMAPSAVKPAIRGTAQDRGPTGPDPDWGAGLLDAAAVVAAAAGGTGSTTFPTHEHVAGSVVPGATWTHAFEVAEDGLEVPVAVTIVIDGDCLFLPGFGCWPFEWSPDLDARLRGPGGAVLDESTCALGAECSLGRQETLHVVPAQAGTYTVEVYAFGAEGGSFSVDVSHGPAGVPEPPPPPPPPPPPTATSLHVGDLDGTGVRVSSKKWDARVTVRVHDDLEAAVAGVTVAVRYGTKGSVTCVTNDVGRCTTSKRYGNAKAQITVRVLGLTGALPYDATVNHDPDADSTGTSIVVRRP